MDEQRDVLPLRYYQHDAIKSVEDAITDGKDRVLLAMATGTGKTRTAICMVYRLIKAKRFRSETCSLKLHQLSPRPK